MLSDTLTFLVFAVLLIGFLGLLQIWLWRKDRTLVVLGIWGAGHLVGALGLILLAGRAFLPDRVSIDAANASILLGFGLAWVGARRLERRSTPIGVVLGGAAVWLVACQVPVLYADMSRRIAIVAIIVAVYDILTMREFLRERVDSVLPSRRALGVTFGVLSCLQVHRAVLAVTVGYGLGLFYLPDSPWLTLSAMTGIVLAAGTSVLLIAVAKEESEQRSIATLALARDTADRANVAKSRFLARMSHELRTPLNGVLGMAQALTRDPLLHGEQRERVVLLEQAGRHLLAIVNDLLDLARVESGKFELSPRSVLVRDIVHGGVDLVAETAAAKNVTLRVDVAAEVPPAVRADPLRVRQIVVNLMGNGIKFTPPGGQVVLSVTRHAPSGDLRLSVTDSGSGVAPEVVPHLFQDFTQNLASDVRSEGTGLGLAISASLAQAMGGRISYQPGSAGSGSVFTVDLPLLTAEPPAPLPAEPVAVALPKRDVQVLVVDDVPSNRKVAEAFLRQVGLSTAMAGDGAAAVAAVKQGPVPDLVLMDVYMPGMDGLMATRAIRALGGSAGQVPIIALTADLSPEQVRACREAGMNGFIAKPLDFAELLAVIVEAVPGASAILPAGRFATPARVVASQ